MFTKNKVYTQQELDAHKAAFELEQDNIQRENPFKIRQACVSLDSRNIVIANVAYNHTVLLHACKTVQKRPHWQHDDYVQNFHRINFKISA